MSGSRRSGWILTLGGCNLGDEEDDSRERNNTRSGKRNIPGSASSTPRGTPDSLRSGPLTVLHNVMKKSNLNFASSDSSDSDSSCGYPLLTALSRSPSLRSIPDTPLHHMVSSRLQLSTCFSLLYVADFLASFHHIALFQNLLRETELFANLMCVRTGQAYVIGQRIFKNNISNFIDKRRALAITEILAVFGNYDIHQWGVTIP